jgi:hypothetical protein
VKQTSVNAWLFLAILFALPGCEREAPPKPVGSATNKHTEESSIDIRRGTAPRDTAETIAGAMKSEAERAHQAEGGGQGGMEPRGKPVDAGVP